MPRIFFAALCTYILCTGCAGSRIQNHSAEETTHVLLDSLVVVADRTPTKEFAPVIHGSERRIWDLLHTRLDLSFDWQNLLVHGSANLTLTPLLHSVDSLILNAQFFDIHSLATSPDALKDYTYDGNTIRIRLRDTFSVSDTLQCMITYTAHPHSAPSRDNQGLFFIDPQDTLADLPKHLWTIGETQYNSQWFPTIDFPNERQTQDFSVTIDSHFVSLSNGTLLAGAPAKPGFRTDRWMLDKPHAPYLAMLAIGDYDVVRDTFNGIPCSYFVDKGYGPSAREIFAHTGEMLSFFSSILHYPYPWSKYDQVVVHEFTAGAMENTTAVTFSNAVQYHARDLLVTGSNDDIVAHEMFHHWFGDLVTCESWAQLTLNEGFANYGEYLWADYKYGPDDAQGQYLEELQTYLSAAESGIRPLIDFQYDHADDLFDAHSYNKGCLVLHHLRQVVGDSAFFRGVRSYLKDNAFNAVEIQHLRLAMEEASGMDLHTFFEQWYFSAGHPIVSISEQYNPATKILSLHLSQEQDSLTSLGVFSFPLKIWLFDHNGMITERSVQVSKRHQVFGLPVDWNPSVICYDPLGTLPWSFTDNSRSLNQCRIMMQHTNPWLVRRQAVVHLIELGEEVPQEDFQYLLSDPHWTIREFAISAIPPSRSNTSFTTIRKMALHDKDIRVRLGALSWLSAVAQDEDIPLFTALIHPRAKTQELSLALKSLIRIDSVAALLHANELENDSSSVVLTAVSEVYANWPNKVQAPFFRRAMKQAAADHAHDFFGFWAVALFRLDQTEALPEITFLKNSALETKNSLNVRYYSMFTLWILRESSPEGSDFQHIISKLMLEIREKTTNSELLDLYQNFN